MILFSFIALFIFLFTTKYPELVLSALLIWALATFLLYTIGSLAQ